MIVKFTALLLFTLAVSANPAANKPWLSANRNLRVDVVENLEAKRPTRRVAQDVVVVSDCGKAPLAPPVKGVIVGGTEAVPHSFPWQVALYIDNKEFCSGTVISDEWVMTAAHCVDGAEFIDVVAGAHNLTKDEPSQVTMRSTDFFYHEEWDVKMLCNDIGMIRLPEKLTFNDYIQPICLPFASERDLGQWISVISTGWGQKREYGKNSPVLMEVENETLENYVCAYTFGSKVTPAIICTDSYGGFGTCYGDSGGPLNYRTDNVTETRGIVSYGSPNGCKAGFPDVFTRVTHYLDWIKTNTGVTRG